MRWPARVVANGRRSSTDRAYHLAYARAARFHTPEPASWWGFCTLLSSLHMRQGRILPSPDLWSELLPFLLVRDEELAARAVEEYILYLEDPRLADKQWLGELINETLEGVERIDDSVAALLEHPATIVDARWMALLSYQTLLRVRRAVLQFARRAPAARHDTFWHGHSMLADPEARSLDGGGACPTGRRTAAVNQRRAFDEQPAAPSRPRHFLPVRPLSLS